jgi:hypothetical protein
MKLADVSREDLQLDDSGGCCAALRCAVPRCTTLRLLRRALLSPVW